ncbi:MAG: hypothetical protein HRT47_09295 [Candidatus Caenarcaniphilales bacterium]|nr:hypothetical protein [Candidatus Caenarcaniphilales bacterium]
MKMKFHKFRLEFEVNWDGAGKFWENNIQKPILDPVGETFNDVVTNNGRGYGIDKYNPAGNSRTEEVSNIVTRYNDVFKEGAKVKTISLNSIGKRGATRLNEGRLGMEVDIPSDPNKSIYGVIRTKSGRLGVQLLSDGNNTSRYGGDFVGVIVTKTTGSTGAVLGTGAKRGVGAKLYKFTDDTIAAATQPIEGEDKLSQAGSLAANGWEALGNLMPGEGSYGKVNLTYANDSQDIFRSDKTTESVTISPLNSGFSLPIDH